MGKCFSEKLVGGRTILGILGLVVLSAPKMIAKKAVIGVRNEVYTQLKTRYSNGQKREFYKTVMEQVKSNSRLQELLQMDVNTVLYTYRNRTS